MNALSTKTQTGTTASRFGAKSSPNDEHVISHRLGGFRAGPSVLVVGHKPVINMVYARLLRLPTLGWMRGSLTLIFLETVDQFGFETCIDRLQIPQPDELVFLPCHLDVTYHKPAAKEGYWTVLRTCTSLGMIEGRGVKTSTFETRPL